MLKKLGLIITVFTLLTLSLFSETLELKLKKDSTYYQKIVSTSLVTQTFNEQAIELNMGVSGVMAFKVIDFKDNIYTMEVKYEQLGLSMGITGGETTDFNSNKNDTNDMVSTILKNMIKKSFNLKMDKTGKILEVTNIEKLYESMFEGLENVSDEQKEQIKAQLMTTYGSDSLKGNIEMSTAIFPTIQVKKGDKWNIITDLSAGFIAKLNSTYELKEINKDSYTINGNGTLTSETNDKYVESNGVFIKYNIGGAVLSQITVDKATGWISESKITQTFEGTNHIKFEADSTEDTPVPMNMKTDILITAKQ